MVLVVKYGLKHIRLSVKSLLYLQVSQSRSRRLFDDVYFFHTAMRLQLFVYFYIYISISQKRLYRTYCEARGKLFRHGHRTFDEARQHFEEKAVQELYADGSDAVANMHEDADAVVQASKCSCE